MASQNKTKKVYKFFVDAEITGRVISLKEIAEVSGWSLSTVRTYRAKKWHFFLRELENGYVCKGINRISEDAFIRLHTQRAILDGEILRPRFTPTVDALLDKAQESALLAVQIYNNPLIKFRTPGFVVQMVIAYSSLFHAVFERNGINYCYINSDGSPKMIDGDRYAWDVSECVKQYYGNQVVPQAENLRFFINIRNKIEHRFIPALDLTFSGKCQALLMNFEELLTDEFGPYFGLGTSLSLALQFSTYSDEQQAVLRRIQTDEYEAIKKYSDAYDIQLPPNIVQDLKYSFRAFLIPKIGNHAKSSDIAIEFVKYDPDKSEEMERYEKQVAFIRDKLIPVSNKDKLLPSEVVKQVVARTGRNFNQSHHTKAWKMYKVRPQSHVPQHCQTEYCQFDAAFKQFVYTTKWVDWLCEAINNADEFEKIKRYREQK